MGALRDKTVKGMKWNAIGKFSTQGVNFLVGLVLARLLSPSDYGVIGMVAVFFSIAQTFIEGGFGSALIRKKECSDIDYSTAFYCNIFVALLCCVVLSLVSPFIADFFDTPILEDVIKVLSLNTLIGAAGIVYTSQLTRDVNFKAQAKVSLASSFVSGLVGVLFAYNGFGVWSLVFQNLTATIVRVVCLCLVTKWIPKFHVSYRTLRYLLGFGSKILAANMLHSIYCNLTTFLIGKLYTAKDLGYYSRGESLSSFASSNIAGVIQNVTYPVLSKLQSDDDRLILLYRRFIAVTSLVVFFIMFILAALAKPLVATLLTEKWMEAVIFLQVFCFAYMFDHICYMNLNILYVKGHSNLVLRLEIIKKTISISMILIAIKFGVLAICIARALYAQIAVIANTYYSGKLYGLGYIEQVKDYGKYFIFSAISVVPAYLITFTSLNSIIQLIVGGTMALLIYYCMLRNDSNLKELLEIIKSNLFGKKIGM